MLKIKREDLNYIMFIYNEYSNLKFIIARFCIWIINYSNIISLRDAKPNTCLLISIIIIYNEDYSLKG